MAQRTARLPNRCETMAFRSANPCRTCTLFAAFLRIAALADGRGARMKRSTIAVTAFALSMVPTATMAQERAGDAALGAVSGAVVLGPVGAVAGALIGYTTGPSISRSWGLRGSNRAGRTIRSAR